MAIIGGGAGRGTGWPLLEGEGCGYWMAIMEVIIQRVVAAKSLSHAKGGTVFAAYIKILPFSLFPGMISRALYPDHVACVLPEECMRAGGSRSSCYNSAYPRLLLGILPAGFKGVMLAVILAALMSNLTSIFNSASAMFTLDLWPRLRPKPQAPVHPAHSSILYEVLDCLISELDRHLTRLICDFLWYFSSLSWRTDILGLGCGGGKYPHHATQPELFSNQRKSLQTRLGSEQLQARKSRLNCRGPHVPGKRGPPACCGWGGPEVQARVGMYLESCYPPLLTPPPPLPPHPVSPTSPRPQHPEGPLYLPKEGGNPPSSGGFPPHAVPGNEVGDSAAPGGLTV
ncbi:Sodium/glucose cotransporter 5 [Chionoecetes opilio]|uniref:Sodium/glucose cotransporter 5 n=1 Tax=Chionoecetes opilio TaxID=41210 RepID=A0A8J5CT26_CHIOP|nr:Sodium/glucose cotransporter 5 [Chionoecetes opilio]